MFYDSSKKSPFFCVIYGQEIFSGFFFLPKWFQEDKPSKDYQVQNQRSQYVPPVCPWSTSAE